MNTRFSMALFIALTVLSLPVTGHDPSLHRKQGAAAPDCTPVKDMDMSKVDMKDPLMRALYDKCKDQMKGDEMKHDDAGHHDNDQPGVHQEPEQPGDDGGRK